MQSSVTTPSVSRCKKDIADYPPTLHPPLRRSQETISSGESLTFKAPFDAMQSRSSSEPVVAKAQQDPQDY